MLSASSSQVKASDYRSEVIQIPYSQQIYCRKFMSDSYFKAAAGLALSQTAGDYVAKIIIKVPAVYFADGRFSRR